MEKKHLLLLVYNFLLLKFHFSSTSWNQQSNFVSFYLNEIAELCCGDFFFFVVCFPVYFLFRCFNDVSVLLGFVVFTRNQWICELLKVSKTQIDLGTVDSELLLGNGHKCFCSIKAEPTHACFNRSMDICPFQMSYAVCLCECGSVIHARCGLWPTWSQRFCVLMCSDHH